MKKRTAGRARKLTQVALSVLLHYLLFSVPCSAHDMRSQSMHHSTLVVEQWLRDTQLHALHFEHGARMYKETFLGFGL